MATPQLDFSDIAKPLSAGMRGGVHTDAPRAQDYSSLMDNSKREGTYKMSSSEGHTLQIPYSKVETAQQSGLALDAADRGRYEKDFNFAKEEADPHKWGHRITRLLPLAGGMAGEYFGAGLGAAGGALAGGVGAIPGTVAGGLGGAAVGGMAGKAAEDFIDDVVFGDKPKSVGEEIKDIALSGGEQGLYSGLGMGAGAVIGKGLGWAGRTLAETTSSKLPSAIRMLPSEARGAEPGWMEKFVKESIFAAPVMKAFRTAQEAETKAAIENLSKNISSFTGKNEELGNMVKDAIDARVKDFRVKQNALYNAIDATAKNNKLTASMRPMKQFAKDELARITREEATGGKTQLQPLRQMLEEITQAKDNVEFQAIRDRRSTLLDLAKSEDIPLAGKRAGLAKKLASLADESMEAAARSLDKDVVNAAGKVTRPGVPGFSTRVRRANALTRGMHERFETDLVKKVIAGQTPENIGNIISKPVTKAGDYPFSTDATRALFKMLKPQEAAAVQRRVITNFMESAIRNKPLMYEKAFAKRVLDIGEDRGRIIFGKNWQNVKDLSEMLSHIGGREGLGSGLSLRNAAALRNLLGVIGGGALIGSIGGGGPSIKSTAEGMVVEGIPILGLAAIMTRPAMAIRLLTALRLASATAGRTGIPLASAMMQESMAERRRQEEARARGENPIDESTAAPDTATPPDQQTTYTLQQLQGQAAEQNPAAQSRALAQYAQGPDGHVIGSDDGQQWFDAETGEQVQ